MLQAHRGESAVSIPGERTPDLIISDIAMPGMDGFDLLERVRANDAWYPIPFIFLTAKTERSDIRYGMGVGADNHLPKPFELAELLSAVEARLARAAATRTAIRRDTASQGEVAGIAGEGGGASAQALVARGDLLRLEGRYAEAMAHSSQAPAWVSGAADRDWFVRTLAHRNAGLCQIRLGDEEAGRQTLAKALRLYEDLGSPYDVGTVHNDLGLAYEVAGDLEGAVCHHEAALRCWEDLGNLGPWADTLHALGRYDEALPVLHESAAKAQQAGNVWVEARARVRLGDLHRDLEALGQARGQYAGHWRPLNEGRWASSSLTP